MPTVSAPIAALVFRGRACVLRRRALRAPAVEKRLIAQGADAVPGTPRELDEHVRSARASRSSGRRSA
jgi:hypothetical protein